MSGNIPWSNLEIGDVLTIAARRFNDLRTQNDQLRAVIERLQGERNVARDLWDDATKERDKARTETERLRATLTKGRTLVEDMDLRMPDQATEDADGWINSYRIPVGPWHRLLGWSRGEAQSVLGNSKE